MEPSVVNAFKALKPYVYRLESHDPQFKAVEKVAKRHGLKALGVVVGNALVSYRLSGHGEDYWEEFGNFFEREEPTFENLLKFLKVSKYNKALKEQKLKRLMKARPALEELSKRPEDYVNLNNILALLKKYLNIKGNEKTAVFAVKMAYYAFRASGKEAQGDVPVPVDLRLATLACTSGLVEGEVQELMGAKRDLVIKAFKEVAKEAGIKMINLDALAWLPMRGVRELLCKGDVDAARKRFVENLLNYSVPKDVSESAASALIRKPCC